MTKEQVMNATGSELDELVALAQGWHIASMRNDNPVWGWSDSDGGEFELWEWYHPSTNGTQCMEIMQREKIGVIPVYIDHVWHWEATLTYKASATGETTMIAICRCFVLSKLKVLNGD